MLLHLLFLSFLNVSFASVDLHMHLTMDVPLSPFYSGNLNTGVVATDWKSRLKSRDFDQWPLG
jgi:hypothetical protein